MDQMQVQLEMAAFDEKIALAKLEESKAAERVKELEYEKSRFQMEFLRMVARSQDAARQQQAAQAQPPQPPKQA